MWTRDDGVGREGGGARCVGLRSCGGAQVGRVFEETAGGGVGAQQFFDAPAEIIVASVDEARIDPNWLSVQNESRAQTDEHGRFLIERVAPGSASVYWRPAKWDARTTGLQYYHHEFLDVVPGQTIRVDLTQEAGRPLVGRVVVPDAAGHRLELAGSSACLLVKLPEVPYPPGLAQKDRQE